MNNKINTELFIKSSVSFLHKTDESMCQYYNTAEFYVTACSKYFSLHYYLTIWNKLFIYCEPSLMEEVLLV